ncbi:MAG: thioredoxin-like domain-containing protein [Spirochaetia bacterium]
MRLRGSILVFLVIWVLFSCATVEESTNPNLTEFQRSFVHFLVDSEGNQVDDSILEETQYLFVYYSASWCGPCHRFTPGLVDFYERNHERYGNFEVVLYSWDRSASDTYDYMEEYGMEFPTVNYYRRESSGLDEFEPNGIPTLVLLDSEGNIVQDSWDGDQYLGAGRVLTYFDRNCVPDGVNSK